MIQVSCIQFAFVDPSDNTHQVMLARGKNETVIGICPTISPWTLEIDTGGTLFRWLYCRKGTAGDIAACELLLSVLRG